MRAHLSLLFITALALSACDCNPRRVPDAGPSPDASFDFDAGDEDAGFEEPDAGDPDAGPPPELKLTRLLPPRGASGGGTSVLLEGSGFLRDFAPTGSQASPVTTLRIGGNSVQDFQIIDDTTIELRTPPGLSGAVSVSIRNPNGSVSCNNCFTYFDELQVSSLTPREGPLSGGNELTLNGGGFSADTQVLFGPFSSPHVTFVSSTQLKAVAPRGQAAGPVDVVLYNKSGLSTNIRAYTYLPEVRLSAVSPATGVLAGGTVVRLVGTGLTGATAVRFGSADATNVTVVSGTEITAETPPGVAGAVDVTITTPTGQWTMKRGFTYYDAAGSFAVLGISPRLLRAGETVLLTGQALDQGTLDVTIGGVTATVGARTFSTAELLVPARAGAPRISDVVAVGPSTATLPGGATWRMTLGSLSPTTGPAAGGTSVSAMGGSIPPAVEVTVGTFGATSVSVASENALQFTTPAGSGGAASDVLAHETGDLENEAVLVGGFQFLEPLSIGRVQPERGAIAGGTLVTVLGAGFGESTVVKFGSFSAKDLKLVDSHTITCRTPKGSVGVVDVKVERLTESDVLPGGFSYFDPRSISGGLSGGPLVGTVNVTVLDSTRTSYGAPVAGAQVMLGLDSTTPFQGFTDQRGQITFSDPSLVKAQTVTAMKDFYESATVTGVNAENITVFIARTGGGEPSPGQPPPGPVPSTIEGRVTGFKSPRPLMPGETLQARVFVAQTSLYGGPPFANAPDKSGEKWQLNRDGAEYLVYTGAGLRAVYAVLGIAGANNSFEPVAMGVKKGITTSPENPATGKDIIIDMALEVSVPIAIDSPLTFGGLPGLNSVYSWLELGAEGFVPNPHNWLSSPVASQSASLTLPSFPRLDGTNFIFLNESKGDAAYPTSYYFRRQPGNLSTGVTIGPMLPTPIFIRPLGSFTGTISWSMAPGAVPNLHNVQILRPTGFSNVTVWSMVVPGTENQVVVPQMALDKLNREEAGNSLFVVILSSRSPKFAYNQWTYETLSGVTWSSYTLAVSSAFTP